jgi:hypothetical protein
LQTNVKLCLQLLPEGRIIESVNPSLASALMRFFKGGLPDKFESRFVLSL